MKLSKAIGSLRGPYEALGSFRKFEKALRNPKQPWETLGNHRKLCKALGSFKPQEAVGGLTKP